MAPSVDEEGEAYAWPYVELDSESKPGKRETYRPALAYAKTLVEIVELGAGEGYRLTPENLVERTNGIYAEEKPFSPASRNNQIAYRSLIEQNWLLTGAAGNNEEDTKTNTWQSRNIAAQAMVLVKTPNPWFPNYSAFQKFALVHGVSCPVYKVRSDARKRDHERPVISTMKISIGPKGRTKQADVHYAHEGAYSSKMGLASLYGYAWQADTVL